MKFSSKKKKKMRKQRQRRINRCCSHMIGCTVDYDNCCEVIDQAKIKDTMYLLTIDKNGEHAIYKIVSAYNQVKLSAKKVLENQKFFCNHNYWYEHSTIEINANGEIESVKYGSIFGPYNASCRNRNQSMVICIIADY